MARFQLTPFPSGGSLLGDPFLSLHREMNRLFDDVLRGTSPAAQGAYGENLVPAHMNVSETEKEIRVTAELPGVRPEAVDVTLEDDVLTIRGEKRFEREDEKENFHFVERSYGKFQRSLRLPFSVAPEQVQANFEHGVLTVTLPKAKAQERSRRIQIQAGAGAEQGKVAQGAPSAKAKGEPR